MNEDKNNEKILMLLWNVPEKEEQSIWKCRPFRIGICVHHRQNDVSSFYSVGFTPAETCCQKLDPVYWK